MVPVDQIEIMNYTAKMLANAAETRKAINDFVILQNHVRTFLVQILARIAKELFHSEFRTFG
jgi:hypothetical protein